MSTNATLSILGLYNHDNTLFDEMVVPTGINIEALKNNILMECAEFEVVYPNPNFMKFAIGEWSKSRVSAWQKVKELYDIDLSPEHDYNFTRSVSGSKSRDTDNTDIRILDLSDRKTGRDTKNSTGTQTVESESSNSSTDTKNLVDTNQVSAYNSSSFSDRERTNHTGTDTIATESEDSTTRTDNLTAESVYNSNISKTGSEEKTHDGNEDINYFETVTEEGHKGDIAKTIKDAFDVVGSIYDYIIADFKLRFCIMIY